MFLFVAKTIFQTCKLKLNCKSWVREKSAFSILKLDWLNVLYSCGPFFNPLNYGQYYRAITQLYTHSLPLKYSFEGARLKKKVKFWTRCPQSAVRGDKVKMFDFFLMGNGIHNKKELSGMGCLLTFE